MTISKDFRFPVSVHWQGQQLVHVEAPDVDEIVVAVPPGVPWARRPLER